MNTIGSACVAWQPTYGVRGLGSTERNSIRNAGHKQGLLNRILTLKSLHEAADEYKTTSPNNGVKYWKRICEEAVFVPYSPSSCRHYNFGERGVKRVHICKVL
jgi:hypothetical protein